ncbi:MAG: LysR substrate-binding domain-containing protein, partial [Legionella sp.]
MKLPSLKQLQHLVTLYDYQHFGRAAEACFISQSTLSASIINLEEVLQAQLLERDHKTFLFTPLGEEIVRRSRLLLKQSEELCDYAVHQGQAMQGNFYMGIIPTIAPFIVNELLNQCAQRYPDLTLFVREDTTDNVLQLLAEGKLDLVVLALPYATADFHTKVLARDYFRLVAPKSWFAQGYETDLAKVPDQSIFLLEKEHCLTGHALQACQLKDGTKINSFHATSLHTLIHMVSHQPGLP